MGLQAESRFDRYFRQHNLATPCLLIDLDVVARQYRDLTAAFSGMEIYYAVKANPHPQVVRTLVELGSSFDVASAAEIDLCFRAGALPGSISYGSTIKRSSDISYAYRRGIRQYAFDSECELRKIARSAPGSAVYCRLLVSGDGAQWPLSRKFGCTPDMAADLLTLARFLGLEPCGVSFHVGSQQLDPNRWCDGLMLVASVFAELRSRELNPSVINLGGGFAARYGPDVPAACEYAKIIYTSLRNYALRSHRLVAEPGRFLVGDAGLLRSRIILISHKEYGADRRWVYLDIGRFGGLAETENEAIRYPLVTSKDGLGSVGPVARPRRILGIGTYAGNALVWLTGACFGTGPLYQGELAVGVEIGRAHV